MSCVWPPFWLCACFFPSIVVLIQCFRCKEVRAAIAEQSQLGGFAQTRRGFEVKEGRCYDCARMCIRPQIDRFESRLEYAVY